MPRKPRFAPPGYYLHITQRGNYRQRTFFSGADHTLFLELLALHADSNQVDLLAYWQMSTTSIWSPVDLNRETSPASCKGLAASMPNFCTAAFRAGGASGKSGSTPVSLATPAY